MAPEANPLFDDRLVDLLLESVVDLPSLCAWPAFADQSYESYRLVLDAARRLARGPLFEAYRAMDQDPPRYEGGRVVAHPAMRRLYPLLVETGLVAASRPAEAGGLGLPLTLTATASAYLMAANLGAYAYLGLTAGAAHLVEAFGDAWLRGAFMAPLYEGRWSGTMALTEPGAGSSLADVTTRARPGGPGGTYLVEGSKVFISGGDHDLTENIVHMVLARIEGAPPGIKGVSLFAVPKMRPEGGGLAPNDVQCAGLFHKMGWRGIASVALSFGEAGDCRGWLVGEANRGISYMFQMMNEARLMVGFNGAATASVAYHEAVGYARARSQGRPAAARDPRSAQVPIVEHADVRRMLLRQKAVVEGGLGLLVTAARHADAAAHAPDAAERERSRLLLDLLTPVAKSFPAEYGFEANALAVQVHGGYGYTSEYLPEAWLRDQKLNSIHEGTTGIQSLDLLGRKVVAAGGGAWRALEGEVAAGLERARRAGVDGVWCDEVAGALGRAGELTFELSARGLAGDVDGMLRHSADYLALLSVVLVGWQLVAQAGAALGRRGDLPEAFVEGKLRAARYWLSTELPRVEIWAKLCRDDDSYALMPADAFLGGPGAGGSPARAGRPAAPTFYGSVSCVRANRALAAVLLAGWALGPLAPAPLAADEPGAAAKKKAGALFRAGEEAYRKHRYGDAADAFEGAYQVVPHPASMSNAIDARTRAGQNARAAELCALLLRELGPGGSEKERADAERRLAELLPKVGRLVLEGGGASEVAIDGRPAALGTHYVEPGDHLVRAKAQGVPVERALSVPAGAVQRVVLEAPPPPPPPPAPIAKPAAGPAPPPAADVSRAEAPRGKPLAPTWFFVGLGATAVAGGLALWSGLDTLKARDEWDANPTAEGLEAGRDKQLRTNVLLGATGGLALVSGAAAVFATDWSGRGPRRAEGGAGASLRAGPGGVTLRVRF